METVCLKIINASSSQLHSLQKLLDAKYISYIVSGEEDVIYDGTLYVSFQESFKSEHVPYLKGALRCIFESEDLIRYGTVTKGIKPIEIRTTDSNAAKFANYLSNFEIPGVITRFVKEEDIRQDKENKVKEVVTEYTAFAILSKKDIEELNAYKHRYNNLVEKIRDLI